VNAKNGFNGRTPLHNAAANGHKEIVELLIAKGVDVNARDNDGYTPLDWAIMNKLTETADLLRKHGGKTSEELFALFKAAEDGNIEAAKQAIANGIDVNAEDDDGRTPLHRAAWRGHKEVVELLIANGADVNAKDGMGATPLHLAATKEIVELLIAAGADVNAKDGWRDLTPLHEAAGEGHKEVAELLIAEGADVNFKNWDNKTPLDLAIQFGKTETADLLRKHGGKRGVAHVEDRFSSLFKTINQLQHLIIGDDNGGDPDEPSIEKLQGVFVIRGKIGGKYEVQYHTGDNNWQVREIVTLQSNRQLYIDSSSFDEKRFYRIKKVD